MPLSNLLFGKVEIQLNAILLDYRRLLQSLLNMCWNCKSFDTSNTGTAVLIEAISGQLIEDMGARLTLIVIYRIAFNSSQWQLND